MNIRTKIIGGYVLFVALIMAFLGMNYHLVTSTADDAKRMHKASEDVRVEMETENIFQRQVIALNNYSLTGEEEQSKEFRNYQNTFVKKMERLESSLEGASERETLRELKSQYGLLLAKFDRIASLLGADRKEAAMQMELDEAALAEQAVEQGLDKLIKLKKVEIDEAVGQISADKKYVRIFPSLAATIENTEIIYTESQALQQSLEAESNFLKRVAALVKLFLSKESVNINKFYEHRERFKEVLRDAKPLAKSDNERELLDLIEAKHQAFSDAFDEAVKLYNSDDISRALHVEEDRVDRAEDELAQALEQFLALKQQNMKKALDNVLVVNATALSLTSNLALYVCLTLIIGLIVGTISAVRITRPIRQLADTTREIASGNFNVRLVVKNGDEVGHLARSFNRMTETLQATTVSKDYVDGIIKSIGESLVVASPESRILTVNAATCRMSGYAESELIGQPLTMLFAQESGVPVSADAIDNRTVNDVESVYLAKDGSRIPISFSRTALQLDSNRAQGTVCVAKDITERKRAEQSLRESEQKLSLHIRQTPLAVIEWNLKAEVVEWNPAAENVFGYSREEAIGRPMAELLVPKSDRKVAAQEWQALISRKTGRHSFSENLTKAGSTIICDWYNTPLDSEGRVIGVASMVQDFTERARMETTLRQARDVAVESARLKAEFLANMSHEIRTPMNGVIGMTGLLLDTELSVEQREFAETIHSSGDALLTIINDILDFSKIEAGKLQFETLDFDLRNVIEDTVELLAERAYEKKIELAFLIHDDVPTELRGDPGRLRQVLTNLIGNAIKFTEHGEVVVRAEKECDTGTGVVVRFTVSDTGIGISEVTQRNLFQAFTQADGSTTRKYGGTGLGLAISKQLVALMNGKIGVTSEPEKGATFWFTAIFNKQPLNEHTVARSNAQSLAKLRVLIVDDNATNRKILSQQLSSWGMVYDEAASGAQALEMTRAALAQDAAYDLAILDLMMPGMDGIELARAIKSDLRIAGVPLILLTSFGQRGDAALAREAGVAAYLTKPVRQSQLFDCLTEVVGHATATQRFDTSAAQTSSKKLVTKHTLKEKQLMSSKLILLAEDNVVNQKVAMLQLQKLGYRADSVANGREALEVLGRIPYDLVLMDCQMPEMDGYEATAEIRRREEGTGKRMPVVAMTAHALEGEREKCIAAGMDDYISKPVKPGELGAALKRLLADDSKSTREENLEHATV